jgi:diketogulonate reductase-like aldo/keto reductase
MLADALVNEMMKKNVIKKSNLKTVAQARTAGIAHRRKALPFTCRAAFLGILVILTLLILSNALRVSPQHYNRPNSFHRDSVDAPNTSASTAALLLGDMNRRDVLLEIAIGSTATAVLLKPNSALASSSSSTDHTIDAKKSNTKSSNVVLLPSNNPDEKIEFPLASFGLQIYNNDMAYKLTRTAIDVGYRNFFASVLAGNQRGFAKAVKDSGIPRSDLFICGSIVSNRVQGYDAAYQLTTKGWKNNMEEFAFGDIDYLDQILLDYPGPDCPSIRGQWKALGDMYHQNLTRSLAVSNFSPAQLDCILNDATTTVRPVVNQIPFSVAYHRGDASSIINEHKKRNILVQAWSPLGGSLGPRFDSRIKATCAQIGQRYGNKSYAQVALRWIIQKGASFTTQSKSREHFVEDLNIFDFELSNQDMALLDSLAQS